MSYNLNKSIITMNTLISIGCIITDQQLLYSPSWSYETAKIFKKNPKKTRILR